MKGKKEQKDNGAKRYRSPKETMQFLNYYVTIHQITPEEEEAFAAAPASYDDMTEEDWQKEHEAQIEGERQLKDEEEFKAIKRTLYKGIEGKRAEPDSELFRSSKDLLDRVTRFQSDPSSVTRHEMRKFEDDLSVYFSLWQGEDNKRSESASAEKPAETKPDIPPAKRRRARKGIKLLGRELYGLTIERITKAYLDKYG